MRILIIILTLTCTALATALAEAPRPTRALMQDFLKHISAVRPYAASDERFTNPSNSEKIDKQLKELAELSKEAAHDPVIKAHEGYRISRQVLQDHVVETERVFRTGNKSYARWMFNSTLSACMSCHTQVPSRSRPLENLEGEPFATDFDQAEFLFATRAFDKAQSMFDKMIAGYPANQAPNDELETALEREVAYYARIKRDPEGAIAYFKKYENDKKIPEYLRRNMTAWIKQFQDWKSTPTLDPRKATDAQIGAFAKSVLEDSSPTLSIAADNPRLVTYLKLSGYLYEFLQAHPNSKQAPKVLYWLSLCDRAINNNFFISLADIYLKECMIRYSQDPVAKQCYKEYEDQTVLSYSGSSGVNVPDEVRAELKRLNEVVNAGPKVKVKNEN